MLTHLERCQAVARAPYVVWACTTTGWLPTPADSFPHAASLREEALTQGHRVVVLSETVPIRATDARTALSRARYKGSIHLLLQRVLHAPSGGLDPATLIPAGFARDTRGLGGLMSGVNIQLRQAGFEPGRVIVRTRGPEGRRWTAGRQMRAALKHFTPRR